MLNTAQAAGSRLMAAILVLVVCTGPGILPVYAAPLTM
jgi:hypothetical protein